MKKDIHPKYLPTTFACGCGEKTETFSTLGGTITVEVCSNCHPVYTGKEKIVDTEGRIDRFKKKYAQK